MKKNSIVTILLAVIMSMVWADGYSIEIKNADGVTIYYTLDDYSVTSSLVYTDYDGEATVTYHVHPHDYDNYRNWYSGNVIIPESVEYMGKNYIVTRIGQYAFYECDELTSVTIPDRVSIGVQAFKGCSSLTSITIPNGVSIGVQAFMGCSGLTSITISNGVSIGDDAFRGCSSLTTVTTFANWGFETKWSAFSDCNITTINGICGENVYYSYNIKTHTLTISGEGDMEDYDTDFTSPWYHYEHSLFDIHSLIIESGVTSIGNHAFSQCSNLTSVTIPNSVTYIGKWAFYGCSSLASMTIPNSVKKINWMAFMGCSSMTSLIIGNSLTDISGDAFEGCKSLTSIKVVEGNPKYDSRNNCNALIETSTNILIMGCNNTIIPNGVTSIGGGAFHNCSGLTSIVIPSSVTSIAYYAFMGCSDLAFIQVESGNCNYDSRNNCNAIINSNDQLIVGCKNTIIPNSVTSIGQGAFSGCSGLTSITIPNSVLCIGDEAFDGCSGLTSVTIPNRVTSIGKYAFLNCSSLTSVTIPNSVIEIGSSAFSACRGLTSVTIPNNVKEICDYTFSSCSGLTSVVIPNSVVSIGACAFQECSSLRSITFPNSLTTIANKAFYECSSLTTVSFSNNLEYIGDVAFYGCKSLTSIDIPNSVTFIGERAFDDTAWYDSQPDGLVYAGKVAYEYKGEMPANTRITIRGGTKGIAGSAFSNCSNMTSVIIPNSVEVIVNRAFYGCSGLSSVIIPNSVESIGDYAFSFCKNLTTVTIPNSVTFIGEDAFLDCYGLTSVTIPDGVKSIGKRAFDCCSGLTSVTIPNSVTFIGEDAFTNCTNLTTIVSEIENPFEIGAFDSYSWDDFFTKATLYVPAGTKTTYQATAGWNFTNIVDGGGYVGQVIELDGIKYKIGEYNTGTVTYNSNWFYGDLMIPDQIAYNGVNYTVTSIEYWAFDYGVSYNIKSVTIPSTITSIGSEAFIDQYGITSIRSLNANPPSCFSSSFSGVDRNNSVLWVPLGSLAAYNAADGWKLFQNIRELIPGDANLDGKADAADVVETVNAVKGSPSESFFLPNADQNGNKQADANDVRVIVNIIMGR